MIDLGWAKRFFGSGDKKGAEQEIRVRTPETDSVQPDDDVWSVPEERREAGDAYFESMSRMQTAITKQQYEKAAGLARENLGTIPKWIEEESYNAAMAPVRQGAMDRYLGMDSQVEPELADEERSLLPPSIPVFQQGGHDTGAGRRRGGPVSHGGPCEEHT